MRKIRNIIVWIILFFYMVIMLGLIEDRSQNVPCKEIRVRILDSLEQGFITREDIVSIIQTRYKRILGYPVGGINTDKMEKFLNTHPFIKSIEIYKTIDGALNINVLQRKPILRIVNQENQNYYIDKEGVIIPISDKFTLRVLVANGFINELFNPEVTDNINEAGEKEKIVDLLHLAEFISNHDFWHTQIQQIYVDKNGEYEIIPRVGAHIIYFGNFDNYEEKFKKLYEIYKKGFSREGWNKYKSINLKYKGQVVCTLR
jgi:cell division protein FtsQ